MTQKANLFKGQHKSKKPLPVNRHGKTSSTRKGKRFVKPSKKTKDMDADRVAPRVGLVGHTTLMEKSYKELSKFINQCNEIKAATVASKEGGPLCIIKPAPEK